MVATKEAEPPPRVLVIDAYDSFTYNIVSVIECYLGVEVTVIKIDDPIGDLISYLEPFSAVIAGPGPGHPNNPGDVGLFQELWNLDGRNILPVLGICLGFQSLVLAHGGEILQLAEPRHGMVRTIRARDDSIFQDIPNIIAVQYHSLYAKIGDFVDEDVLTDSSGFSNQFESFCPDLAPLAWDFGIDNASEDIGLQRNNPKAILMGVAHKTKPFYGVQFHPESICSSEEARTILPNWWRLAQEWNHRHRYHSSRNEFLPSSKTYAKMDAGMLQENSSPRKLTPASDMPCKHVPMGPLRTAEVNLNGHHDEANHEPTFSSDVEPSYQVNVITRTVDASHITVPNVYERLSLQNGELVVLDSECDQNLQTGRYSIIGVIDLDSTKLEYNIGQSYIRHTSQGETTLISLKPNGGSIFAYLKSFMGQRKVNQKGSAVPFWGGLMGYITYEACLETLKIKSASNPVDLSFAFVERSVVIDHQQRMLHVQSIKPKDHDWVASVASIFLTKLTLPFSEVHTRPTPNAVSLPDEDLYKKNIRRCFDFLRKGDSYELCLTTECRVSLPKGTDSWDIFRRLRKKNAAPFAAFVRLGPLTHIASSPERFLSWSRPARKSPQAPNCHAIGRNEEEEEEEEEEDQMISTVQFRPIKGTVKKQPNDTALAAVTLEEATAILSTPKEQAENLMIVDLIRHDLHSVVGSGNVSVTKLMVVESYATLYQLVSVVEGTLYLNDPKRYSGDESLRTTNDNLTHTKKSSTSPKTPSSHSKPHPTTPNPPLHPPSAPTITGIDVLAASLPPGSMTGAPKTRSCSLLQQMEQRKRGVYSGVLGYMDVGGGGDFSVVIRSAFKWDAVGGTTATTAPCNTGLSSELPRDSSPSQRKGTTSEGFPPDTDTTINPPLPPPSSPTSPTDAQSRRRKTSLTSSTNKLSLKLTPPGREHDQSSSTSASDSNSKSDSTSEETWTIGAGGAVTCLSTEEGEWEEMRGKLASTLAAFF